MEIALLPKSALRIKGKTASFVVNPQGPVSSNAVLLLDPSAEFDTEDAVVIKGAGEYEIGSIKIAGTRNEKSVLYSMHLDGIDLIVGDITLFSAMQHKLKEHNIVVVNCDELTDASFLTSLAVNAVLFYGDNAQEVSQGFEKEKLKQMNKYTASLGKLPAEMETILLASSV